MAAPRPTASPTIGVPASNFHGMLVGGEPVLGDLEDHLAATEERGHGVEQLGAAPEHTDAHGAQHLVAGEDDEVGAHGLHVGGDVGHVLAGVDQGQERRRRGPCRPARGPG